MKKVYLAGPVTGLSWEETESWRDDFKKRLKDSSPHIVGFSPLREKGFLVNETSIADTYPTIFSSQRAIMSRDFFDVSTADALVANLTLSSTVSIGTVMEIAWAYQRRIPVIIISKMKDGIPINIHNHSMLREAANWWIEDQEDAVTIIQTLFTA